MENIVNENPKSIAGEPTRGPEPTVVAAPERTETRRAESPARPLNGPTMPTPEPMEPMLPDRSDSATDVSEPTSPVGGAPDPAMSGPDREPRPADVTSAGRTATEVPTTTPTPIPTQRPTGTPVPELAPTTSPA